METPIKFRNHISVVPERMGRMLVFLAALFFGSLVQNLPDLLEEARSLSEDRNTFLLSLGGILLLFLCFLGYQLLIWAKTWIYVSEGTLVIERRTLNRKVHTIAVRNISNINTEQNLFEMLIGTSKLKLDTNSLSTADKTDVRIVLKTSDAEAFRSYLLSLLHPDQTDPAEGEHGPEHLRPAGPDTYDIHAGLTDICAHGIFPSACFLFWYWPAASLEPSAPFLTPSRTDLAETALSAFWFLFFSSWGSFFRTLGHPAGIYPIL